MKLNSKSGATLAAAAATLFLAGSVVSTVSTSANAAAGVKCVGTNACKGQSACKGGSNSCKGLNACKTNGFSMVSSEAACKAKGGAVYKL